MNYGEQITDTSSSGLIAAQQVWTEKLVRTELGRKQVINLLGMGAVHEIARTADKVYQAPTYLTFVFDRIFGDFRRAVRELPGYVTRYCVGLDKRDDALELLLIAWKDGICCIFRMDYGTFCVTRENAEWRDQLLDIIRYSHTDDFTRMLLNTALVRNGEDLPQM